MMKYRTILLLICLFLLLCAGCTAGKGKEAIVPIEEAGELHEEDIFDPAQVEVQTATWPKDLIPARVPIYTEGELMGYSGVQSVLSLSIANTEQKDVDRYMQALRDNAFSVSEWGIATFDDLEVSVDFLEGSHSVVISITYAGSEVWPGEMIADVPPLNYGVITELLLNDPGVIDMTIKNLTKPHIQLWFDQLEENDFVRSGQTFTGGGLTIEIVDYGKDNWQIKIFMPE